jgi:hypothetical protein
MQRGHEKRGCLEPAWGMDTTTTRLPFPFSIRQRRCGNEHAPAEGHIQEDRATSSHGGFFLHDAGGLRPPDAGSQNKSRGKGKRLSVVQNGLFAFCAGQA